VQTRNVDPGSRGLLPQWAAALAARIGADLPGVPALDQLTVNEYLPGVGLAPHVDTHSAFTGASQAVSIRQLSAGRSGSFLCRCWAVLTAAQGAIGADGRMDGQTDRPDALVVAGVGGGRAVVLAVAMWCCRQSQLMDRFHAVH
jgi:hypothetical protein